MLNQRGFAFVPILIGVIIVITGVAVVSESTGHHLSLSNSPAIEKSNTPFQSQALSMNSPTPANSETTQVSNRIRVQNLQTGQIGTMEEWDFDPKKFKRLDSPQSQTTNNKALTQSKSVKPTDKALRLATYIFTISNETQRNELINKFSNGKSDLKQAINNLALLLDSKPENLATIEKAIAQDIAQKATKKSLDDSDKILNEHVEAAERIAKQNERLNAISIDNIYTGLTQDIVGKPSSPKVTETGSVQRVNPSTGAQVTNQRNEPIRYNTIGDTVYGSDGSRYNKLGDTIYKNDGTRYNTIGDTLYGSDGTRYNTIGDTVYKNDGTRYNTIGDTVYGSDGSRATSIGDTLYVYPGY